MIFIFISSIVSYLLGKILVGGLFPYVLLTMIASYITGTVILIPAIYVLSLLFAGTVDPILFGTVSALLITTGIIVFRRSGDKLNNSEIRQSLSFPENPSSDVLLIATSFVVSSWLMFKSFRQGSGSTLLVGSNEVFDIGHALGLIRSFSWGNNIPFMSPYVAGEPHLYHYMFYFWSGLFEKFGMPMVWALNIPSVIGFTAFLITAFYIPIILFKSGRAAGWITVLLTITHATLTFIYFIAQNGLNSLLPTEIWHLSKYPFAGPFDGSVISLFHTLNVFVNQRHFAFSLAAGMLVYLAAVIMTDKGKRFSVRAILILAALCGLLSGWHIVVFPVSAFSVLFFLYGKYPVGLLILFLSVSVAVSLPWSYPWIHGIQAYADPMRSSSESVAGLSRVHLPVLRYFIDNFGVLLLTVPAGILLLGRKHFRTLVPAGIIIMFSFAVRFAVGRDIDQKFLNFWIVFANAVTAYFLVWIIRRGLLMKISAIILLFMLTASGFIDLMVIKNDFAYPVSDAPDNRMIAFLRSSTPEKSIILSYPEIFDPVAMSGRYGYSGFFRNKIQTDRSGDTRMFYEDPAGSRDLFRKHTIGYIVLPLGNQDLLPYTITRSAYDSFEKVFENDSAVIYKTY